jgi:hypothetical protein
VKNGHFRDPSRPLFLTFLGGLKKQQKHKLTDQFYKSFVKNFIKHTKVLKKSQKWLFLGTPNNTLVLGLFLVGPKTDLNFTFNFILLSLVLKMKQNNSCLRN